MDINIEISRPMTITSKTTEDTYIRMSSDLREKHNLEIGEFVNLRGKNNNLVTLQVRQCFLVDNFVKTDTAFVSGNTSSLLELKTTEKSIEVVNGITLGCDPEFFLINRNTGNIVRARKYLRSTKAAVGCDGDGVLAEIRPRYALDEHILTRNIYDLLRRARSIISSKAQEPIAFIAASAINGKIEYTSLTTAATMVKTAGFHIHFGIPAELLGYQERKQYVRAILVKILDYYLGVPAVVAEGADYERRLPLNEYYGNPGDFKTTRMTLEYRTLGAAMLRHPILTLGLLSIGLLVMEDALSRIRISTDRFFNLKGMETEKDMRDIYPNIPSRVEIEELLCRPTIHSATNRLEHIVRDLESMVGWESRRPVITAFLECLYDGTTFVNDIDFNWRSYYAKYERQMEIFASSFQTGY